MPGMLDITCLIYMKNNDETKPNNPRWYKGGAGYAIKAYFRAKKPILAPKKLYARLGQKEPSTCKGNFRFCQKSQEMFQKCFFSREVVIIFRDL